MCKVERKGERSGEEGKMGEGGKIEFSRFTIFSYLSDGAAFFFFSRLFMGYLLRRILVGSRSE
jgi:hypothetical protein